MESGTSRLSCSFFLLPCHQSVLLLLLPSLLLWLSIHQAHSSDVLFGDLTSRPTFLARKFPHLCSPTDSATAAEARQRRSFSFHFTSFFSLVVRFRFRLLPPTSGQFHCCCCCCCRCHCSVAWDVLYLLVAAAAAANDARSSCSLLLHWLHSAAALLFVCRLQQPEPYQSTFFYTSALPVHCLDAKPMMMMMMLVLMMTLSSLSRSIDQLNSSGNSSSSCRCFGRPGKFSWLSSSSTCSSLGIL